MGMALSLLPNDELNLFNVKKYGAAGDGVTNDATAINAANTAAAAVGGNGGTVYFPPGTYYIASTLTLTANVLGNQAQVNTDQNITAIQLGDGTNYLRDKKIHLPRLKDTSKTGTGWSGASIGVKLVNVYECEIHTSQIENFVTGLLLTTSGAKGTAYNQIHLGPLDDNKVQVKLAPVDTSGWVNENVFHGGRFGWNTAEGTAVAGTRDIHIVTYSDAAANICNNNRFYAPSLEGDVPEYHVDIFGGWNYIRDARWEAITPKVNFTSLSSTVYSARNIIQGGYNAESIVYTADSNTKHNVYHDDIMWAELTVTHDEFIALNSTPLTIVPAPGANKTFNVLGMMGVYNYGGTTTYTHAGSVVCAYLGSTALTQATVGTANFHTSTAIAMKFGGAASNVNIRNNDALVIWASSANPTDGHSSNSFKFRVYYRIVPWLLAQQ